MPYLTAAVIFAAGLGFLNLVLTFAVIRKLRLQAAGNLGPTEFAVPPLLPAGADAPEFSATTVQGGECSLHDLIGRRSLIGFFSTSCKSCRAHLPAFAEFADGIPGGPQQVVAVIEGTAEAAADIIDSLSGCATIVLEPYDGPIACGFAVWGYPTFYALDDQGRILAGGPTVQGLAAAVPV